jgi:phosphatidate cytidylyltransferase
MIENAPMVPLLELADPAVWIGLACVAAFILVSSLVVVFHPRLRERRRVREAILSWWPVTVVGALATLLGPRSAALVLGLVSAGLVREGLALLNLPPAVHRDHLRLGLATAVIVHAMMLVDGGLATTLAFAAAFMALPLLQLVRHGSDDFIRRAGGSAWVIAASVGLFSFIARILVDGDGGPHGRPGVGYAFLVLVMMADALQYIGGKLLGRRPLVPRVSPAKTWEGLLFGVFGCTMLGSSIAPIYLGVPALVGAAIGALTCVLGLCGDLIVSGWKRDAGVKDSGSLLPGQGGLLDRGDSLLFVAPWFYLLVATRIGGVP